jgi:hypothetical protein
MNEDLRATEFKVRVSQDLRRQIEHAAKANGRTMNAEIVARLTWAFEHDNPSPDVAAKVLRVTGSGDVVEQRLAALEAQVRELTEMHATHMDWHLARDES